MSDLYVRIATEVLSPLSTKRLYFSFIENPDSLDENVVVALVTALQDDEKIDDNKLLNFHLNNNYVLAALRMVNFTNYYNIDLFAQQLFDLSKVRDFAENSDWLFIMFRCYLNFLSHFSKFTNRIQIMTPFGDSIVDFLKARHHDTWVNLTTLIDAYPDSSAVLFDKLESYLVKCARNYLLDAYAADHPDALFFKFCETQDYKILTKALALGSIYAYEYACGTDIDTLYDKMKMYMPMPIDSETSFLRQPALDIAKLKSNKMKWSIIDTLYDDRDFRNTFDTVYKGYECLQSIRAEMSKENAELTEKNDLLERENAELKEINKVLERENDQLTEKNDLLEQENGELTIENNELTEKNEELKEIIRYLSGKSDQLIEENEELLIENTELTEVNDQLTMKNEEQNARIEELVAKNERMKGIILKVAANFSSVATE